MTNIFCVTALLSITAQLAHGGIDYDFPTINSDDLSIDPWPDSRTFDSVVEHCDFSGKCGYGSHEPKWNLLNGTLENLYPVMRMPLGQEPDFPILGFGSYYTENAHLFSDPMPCYEQTSGRVNITIWYTGSFQVQTCFLDLSLGLFERCGSTFSSNDTTLNFFYFEEPILLTNWKTTHYIMVLIFEVTDGFVLVDDIQFNGTRCDRNRHDVSPINRVTYSHLISSMFYVRNEIASVLSRHFDHFTQYLISLYRSNENFKSQTTVGCVCIDVACNFDCDWSNYTGNTGPLRMVRVSEFMQNEKGTWQQTVQMAKFQRNEVNFAVLTSPKFRTAGGRRAYSPSANVISAPYGAFTLTFKYNRAARQKVLIVCFFCQQGPKDQTVDLCQQVQLDDPDDGEKEWFTARVKMPGTAVQFQIVMTQSSPIVEPEYEESMIRNINVLGC